MNRRTFMHLGLLVVLRGLFSAWTSPRSWVPNELVTATIMNAHVRDNLDALKAPPSDNYEVNEGADYSTASTTFTDVDATNLLLTITTAGGDVMVHFHGSFQHSGTGRVYLDVDVDSSRIGGDDGIVAQNSGSTASVSFTRLVSGLSAGTHNFKLQWKTNAGTITMYAGAGTSSFDLHPQFWVREMS